MKSIFRLRTSFLSWAGHIARGLKEQARWFSDHAWGQTFFEVINTKQADRVSRVQLELARTIWPIIFIETSEMRFSTCPLGQASFDYYPDWKSANGAHATYMPTIRHLQNEADIYLPRHARIALRAINSKNRAGNTQDVDPTLRGLSGVSSFDDRIINDYRILKLPLDAHFYDLLTGAVSGVQVRVQSDSVNGLLVICSALTSYICALVDRKIPAVDPRAGHAVLSRETDEDISDLPEHHPITGSDEEIIKEFKDLFESMEGAKHLERMREELAGQEPQNGEAIERKPLAFDARLQAASTAAQLLEVKVRPLSQLVKLQVEIVEKYGCFTPHSDSERDKQVAWIRRKLEKKGIMGVRHTEPEGRGNYYCPIAVSKALEPVMAQS